MAKVQLEKKYGIINTKGELILECEYNYLGDFSEGAIMVVKDDKYGFADTSGKIIIPIEYDFEEHSLLSSKFKNNMVNVEKGKKQFLISKEQKRITKKEYQHIMPFSCGLAAIEQDDKWGYIDTTMKEYIPLGYQFADDFIDTIAKVTDLVGKTGFINKKGKTVIEFLYDKATSFKNGFSIVTLNNKRSLINIK
mgnify:CR=1 FL=1